MEKRDLYDEFKILTGESIYKDEPIPEGRYILVVMAFIQNLEGLFLVQKRSVSKGGEWAFTGGHPKSGENSLTGVLEEAREELGLTLENPILFKEIKVKKIFCDSYFVKQDVKLENLVKQESEVEDIAFMTIKEINELYKNHEFKDNHYKMFLDCLEYLGIKND